MIDRDHALCVTKQAELVGIARSTVYYLPRPVSAEDLALMKQIDALHTEFPFAGSRMLRRLLAANGSKVGRRHVKTLMQRMGIEALYRRPRTTRPEPGHKGFPYLLRGIEIERPNQVWAMDITYIPMAIRRQSARRHDHVHVRMVCESGAPGVQHRGDADAGAQMPGIGRDRERGGGRGL